ncbi:MAG: alpha-D-ribose 1-methylphosphonate 5-triphosphate diphosphatase [Thalassobaculales bacterium]
MELALANARIVLPDGVLTGSVLVRDGLIAAIAEGAGVPAGALDLEGDLLIPGLIDLHTDNLEKHMTPRPGVTWNPVMAAATHDAQIASGGITTVYDAICVGVQGYRRDRRSILHPMVAGVAEAQAAGMLRAEHRLHIRCEVNDPDVVAEFEEFAGHPLLHFVSVMDHAPGQRQFASIAAYRHHYQKSYGMTDAQLDEDIRVKTENSLRYAAGNRRRIVEIAASRAIPVASHDDMTVEHVEESAALGLVVAEFPTTIAAAARSRELGLKVLMGSPNVVRGGSHSGNVAAGELARLGLLDILSSDYVPVSLLHGAFTLADGEHGMDLPAAIATVTATPAAAAGLGDRGRIAIGLRADLARVGRHGGLPFVKSLWREGKRVL